MFNINKKLKNYFDKKYPKLHFYQKTQFSYLWLFNIYFLVFLFAAFFILIAVKYYFCLIPDTIAIVLIIFSILSLSKNKYNIAVNLIFILLTTSVSLCILYYQFFVPDTYNTILFFSIIIIIWSLSLITISIFANKLYQIVTVIFLSFIFTGLEISFFKNIPAFYFLLTIISMISFFIYNNTNKMVKLINFKENLNVELNSRLLSLQNIIDNISNPIFVKNKECIFIGCNKAYENFVNLPKEKIIGKNICEVILNEHAEHFYQMDLELLKTGIKQVLEFETNNSSGEKRNIINYKSVYYNTENQIDGIVGEIVDITEVKENNKKVEKINKDLSEANTTKDRFFSIIAHDLRNPVTSLLGLSDLLLMNLKDSPHKEHLEKIEMIADVSKHLASLLENLLDWSRSRLGRISFNPKYTSIFRIIDDNIETFSKIASQKSIEIINKVDQQTYIFVDEKMIDIVVKNLLSNSLKYSTTGGKIIVDSKMHRDFFEVSFIDFGIGIKKEYLPKLFSIDRDFKNKGTDGESGTGLGLILSYEFIKKNNGEISVDSEPGKGTTVTIKLPIKNPE